MKKLIFMGILGLFALGACNNKNTQGHEGHGHEAEGEAKERMLPTQTK